MGMKHFSDYIPLINCDDLDDSALESELSRCEDIDKKNVNNHPKSIYHYTSVSGMKSIIENKKLWFSHSAYLNDPSEIFHSIDAVFTEIEKFDFSFFSLVKEICREKYTRLLKDPPHCYICSFSQKYDDLPLWSMYTQNKGVCIEFECKNESILYKDSFIKLDSVSYQLDPLLKKTKCLMDYIEKNFPSNDDIIKHSLNEPFDTTIGPESPLTQLIAKLEDWLSYIEDSYSLFKNSKYEYENEIRLVLPCKTFLKKESIQFREKNNILIPYVEVSYEKFLNIKSITIAPGQEVIKDSLLFFLNKNKLCDIDGVSHNSAFLRESVIPYRL